MALDQTFTADNLFALRNAVAAHGAELGLTGPRLADLVLLAHELASNAVRHGRAPTPATRAGCGCAAAERRRSSARSATAAPACTDPDRAGTEPVAVTAPNGRGLWIVRQIADEVDIVTGPTGTTITATHRA